VQQEPGRLRAWLLLLASLGCGHTEPFSTNPPATDVPFDMGPPARLTMNQGPDRGAAWLPDGSGILYSSQQLGRRDNDVCLALIPATGGSQRQLTCDLSPTGADSPDAIESPAPTPDGRLAFVARASRIAAITPENWTLRDP
jgi:Tol biopolymer transport system component